MVAVYCMTYLALKGATLRIVSLIPNRDYVIREKFFAAEGVSKLVPCLILF
jgi:hypothetical protein